MDGHTDVWTDRPSYRDVRTHLKIAINSRFRLSNERLGKKEKREKNENLAFLKQKQRNCAKEKMVHNKKPAAFAQGKIVIHLDSAIKNRKCFFDLFAARCKACNHPITSNYISALDGHWHNECFTCRVSREGNMPVLSR